MCQGNRLKLSPLTLGVWTGIRAIDIDFLGGNNHRTPSQDGQMANNSGLAHILTPPFRASCDLERFEIMALILVNSA